MTGPYARAHSLAQIGRYAEAERVTRGALASAPQDGPLLTLLASVQRLQRDYASALVTADSAIAADPLDADAHAERAEILTALLRTPEAVAAAEEATRLDPIDPARHFQLARTLLVAGDPARARLVADHGLSLAPGSVEGLLTIADVERDAGHRDAALTATRAALAVDPVNAYGRWLLAMLDAERLRVRRSMRALTDVARDNPARPDLISLTWPIRGVLSGLRRGLAAAAGLVCLLVLVAQWWSPLGLFARIVAAVLAAVLAGFAARVLIPAGRVPWRCLRLLPPMMLRADLAALTLNAAGVLLLGAFAATGWWLFAVLALVVAPVLWALGFVELLGAGLDDPGFRVALTQIGGEFREWWRTTRRELRDVWKDPPRDPR